MWFLVSVWIVLSMAAAIVIGPQIKRLSRHYDGRY